MNPAAPGVRPAPPPRRPASPAGRPGAAGRDRRARYRRAARLAFLIPAGLYVLFAFVVPVIYNLILSFEQTTPATIASLFAPWTGLTNYKTTLLQSITQSALIRTLSFTVLTCSITSVGSACWMARRTEASTIVIWSASFRRERI